MYPLCPEECLATGSCSVNVVEWLPSRESSAQALPAVILYCPSLPSLLTPVHYLPLCPTLFQMKMDPFHAAGCYRKFWLGIHPPEARQQGSGSRFPKSDDFSSLLPSVSSFFRERFPESLLCMLGIFYEQSCQGPWPYLNHLVDYRHDEYFDRELPDVIGACNKKPNLFSEVRGDLLANLNFKTKRKNLR